MRDVWGASFWTSSKTIDVHLGWVRRSSATTRDGRS